MTFLITFLAIMLNIYLSPLLVRLAYRKKTKLPNEPIWIIYSKFFNSYAYCVGIFNFKAIFVNARFAEMLDNLDIDKPVEEKTSLRTLLIDHERTHFKEKHNEIFSTIFALKYAMIAQVLIFFMPLWLMLSSFVFVIIFASCYDALFKHLFYYFEYKADWEAFNKKGDVQNQMLLYIMFERNRSNSRTPSINQRLLYLSKKAQKL